MRSELGWPFWIVLNWRDRLLLHGPNFASKEFSQQCRRHGFDPWVRKTSWRREWQPTPVLLPQQFRGQRSLAGYSPWDRKESDMTERLTFSHTFHYAGTGHGGVRHLSLGQSRSTHRNCKSTQICAIHSLLPTPLYIIKSKM